MTPDGIHAEGNLPLKDGEQIRVESEVPKDLVPSPNLILEKSGTSDLYYDFHYSYNFNFVFVDPPVLDVESDESLMGFEGTEEEKEELIKKLQSNYEEKKPVMMII